MSAVTRATTPPRTSGFKKHQLDIDGMHWHGFVTPGQKFTTKRLDDEVSTALPSQCTSVGLFDSLPTTPACDYVVQTGQTAPSWEPMAPVWRPSGAFSVDGWSGQPQSGVDLEALKAFLNGDQDVQQPPVLQRPQSPIKEEELDEPLTPTQNAVLAPFSTPPATPRNKSTELSFAVPAEIASFCSPPSTPPRRKSGEHLPSSLLAPQLLTALTLMQHGLDMEQLQGPNNDEELRPTCAMPEVVPAFFSSPPSTPRGRPTELSEEPSCPSAWEGSHPPLEALWHNCLGKELDEPLMPWSMDVLTQQFVTPSLLVPAVVSTPLAPGESPYPPLLMALMQNRLDMVQNAVALDPEVACFPFWDHGVEPPICAALRFGCSVEILEALIKSGANVNAPDSRGHGPLRILRSEASFSTIVVAKIEELLVGAGAEPLKEEAEPAAGRVEDHLGWCFPFSDGLLVNPLLTNFQLLPPPSPNP